MTAAAPKFAQRPDYAGLQFLTSASLNAYEDAEAPTLFALTPEYKSAGGDSLKPGIEWRGVREQEKIAAKIAKTVQTPGAAPAKGAKPAGKGKSSFGSKIAGLFGLSKGLVKRTPTPDVDGDDEEDDVWGLDETVGYVPPPQKGGNDNMKGARRSMIDSLFTPRSTPSKDSTVVYAMPTRPNNDNRAQRKAQYQHNVCIGPQIK